MKRKAEPQGGSKSTQAPCAPARAAQERVRDDGGAPAATAHVAKRCESQRSTVGGTGRSCAQQPQRTPQRYAAASSARLQAGNWAPKIDQQAGCSLLVRQATRHRAAAARRSRRAGTGPAAGGQEAGGDDNGRSLAQRGSRAPRTRLVAAARLRAARPRKHVTLLKKEAARRLLLPISLAYP